MYDECTPPGPGQTDDLETHYAGLERLQDGPCICLDGWVYLGHLEESPDDLDGEVEVIEAVPCRRCR